MNCYSTTSFLDAGRQSSSLFFFWTVLLLLIGLSSIVLCQLLWAREIDITEKKFFSDFSSLSLQHISINSSLTSLLYHKFIICNIGFQRRGRKRKQKEEEKGRRKGKEKQREKKGLADEEGDQDNMRKKTERMAGLALFLNKKRI